MQETSSLPAILAANPFFRDLGAATIAAIAALCRTCRLGAEELLFQKGDPGDALFAVRRGQVRISTGTDAGKRLTLNSLGSGDVFGEIALLDGRPRTADAVALTDCELMTVDRRDFQPFLRDNPDVALQLIEVLCERLRHTSEQVEDVIFLDLPGRLAKTLLHMLARSGQTPPAPLSITQREIGQMIGMSRESANKQLRAWAERGWLRVERGRIVVLNAEALAGIADQDFEPK